MKKITLRRSRKSFLGSYFFALFLILINLFLSATFNFSWYLVYLLTFPSIYLVLLSEYSIISEKVLIKDENIEKISGLISKRKNIISWNLISSVGMHKSLLGRLFDYGDIFISDIGSGKDTLLIKGVNDPEKILAVIENNIGKKPISK